jgi:hypothetical protein
MNVETIELEAVAEVAKSNEIFEVLSLSVADLDLVGGGHMIGSYA